jgi:hypothetical protein
VPRPRTTLDLINTPCTARRPGLAGYKIDHCRCRTCTTAANDYRRRRDRLVAYGRWNALTDADPVRDHLATLRSAGLGVRHVARIAGLGAATTGRLVWAGTTRSPVRRVKPATAAAILAIRPDPARLADGAHVDATGTRRRAQALAAVGWSLAEQARQLGRDTCNHTKTLQATQVTARVARTVATLYDQLAYQPPPPGWVTTRTVRWAARQGFHPPAAWDDIDNPAEQPNLGAPDDDQSDPIAVELALAGKRRFATLNPADRLAVYHRLRAAGAGDGTICGRLRINTRTLAALKAAADGRDGEVAA